MRPKPSKEIAIRYIQKLLPDYGEMLSKIEKHRGWVIFEPWIYTAIENLKISDYAKLYPDESIIPKLFVVALFDVDEFKKLNTEIEQGTPDEQTAFLDDWITDVDQTDTDDFWDVDIPEMPEEQEEAKKLLESLSEEERADIRNRVICYLTFFLITFHNHLAIMVHGRKMTQLVTEAIQGDDDAFVLAAQIDSTVLQSIPYFQERVTLARREGDSNFLDKLAYRQKIPPLQGKIRFRLLYLLFAMLDGMNILNELTCPEILAICDAADLDRWQNRIEDEGCWRRLKIDQGELLYSVLYSIGIVDQTKLVLPPFWY
jgi:hypothetical protein